MMQKPSRELSICIVAHNAYGALTGGQGHIGGVELQTALLARYLVRRGYSVSCIVWDEEEDEGSASFGYRIIRTCLRSAGVPGVRFFFPRWSSLHRAMRDANADIYFHNGAEYVTGQVALFCRRNRKKFVFSAASDTDCYRDLPALPSFRERSLYRFGLRIASRIIVQTTNQRDSLQSGFGLHATVLSMPCDLSASRRTREPNRRSVIWVGRIVRTKRLEILLDVASRATDIQFHIAGGADDDLAYADSLQKQATSLGNVIWHGPLKQPELFGIYAECDALLCTSCLEGFPNTFLEAWAHGLPIISTFDPDGLIERLQLGSVVATADEALVELRAMLDDDLRWEAVSQRCADFFNENHAADVALRRYEDIIVSAIDDSVPSEPIE
jgi:glycosyltransferase involved in cell wall biosynthesis